MVDFHSHILPAMDDGASTVEESISLLRESVRQGVTTICATPHFRPDDEDPASFLRRRTEAGKALQQAMRQSPGKYPRILLRAEVEYYPGISASEDIKRLRIGKSACLLIEPLMLPWSDYMLDEIEALGDEGQCVPVIAHVDRYMRFLQEPMLLDRLAERRIMAQVNASFFLYEDSAEYAIQHLRRRTIRLIGSDCHNMTRRPPNMGAALRQIRAFGEEESFSRLNERAEKLLEPIAKP